MVASVAKNSTPGAVLRDVTVPYERFLGIWQQWGMFAPAPNGSSALMATGFSADGEAQIRPVLFGERGVHFAWFYDRSLKLERSTFTTRSSRARALRRSYGQWICQQAEANGSQLTHVELWKRRILHPTPAQRLEVPGGERTINRVDLQTIRCEGPTP